MKTLFVVCVALWTRFERTKCGAVCWDTGCQLDSWAVRGCQQYGMIETGRKSCPDGLVYSCCEPSGASSSSSTKPKCWDTGCQLDSWAVRGCQQYGMAEVGRRNCDNGVVYSCCETSGGPPRDTRAKSTSLPAPPPHPAHALKPICWDTGCQPHSWATRGCEQYGMVEVGQRACADGLVYSCCEKNDVSAASASGSEASSAIVAPPLTTASSKPAEALAAGGEAVAVVTPSTIASTGTSSPARPKCWDTGCQLDAWAVRGCEQYNMVEVGRHWCQNGIVYSCCEKNDSASVEPFFPSLSSSSSSSTTTNPKPKCWDTGCQLDSWAVRGCEQYGMTETGRKSCPNGIVYSCCEQNETSSATVSSRSKPKCWDTGCQLDSWAVRGCEQYDMLDVGQKACPNGVIYSCCDKNITTAPPPKVEVKCWDTGCQLDSWAVRGCEQYDMLEVSRKPCQDGVVYSCCRKNGTTSAIRTPKKCWDTGCQLDVWRTRGCEQYGMIEKAQRTCSNGVVFTCCRP